MRGSRLRIIEEIETFAHTSHSSLPGSFVQIMIRLFQKINYPRSFEKANAIPGESLSKVDTYFVGMA